MDEGADGQQQPRMPVKNQVEIKSRKVIYEMHSIHITKALWSWLHNAVKALCIKNDEKCLIRKVLV